MSGGGPQTQTTSQQFKPPDYAVQGWQDYLSGAQDLTQQPFTPYGGMTVAPLNGQQSQAQNFIEDRALTGAPDLNAARGSNMNISQGGMLSNPYGTPDYTNQLIGDTANNMANAYATGTAADQARNAQMAGAFGGGGDQAMQLAGQRGLEQQVGQMANQYMAQMQGNQMNDYRSGVNQMLGANQGSGQLSQDDWTAANMLRQNGNDTNAYVQALLNAGQNQFNQANNYPAQQLGMYGQALGAASGQGGTTIGQTSQTGTPSWVTGGLGGLAGLAGLLNL